MKFTSFFMNNRKMTKLILILIAFAGILSIYGLPRQDSPNVNFNLLNITTFYPGASPEDVEINVTDQIEDELEKVDGIDEMSSFSIEGMSWIFVKIDPDIEDTQQVKDDVKSAVDRVSDLPAQVEDRPQISEMKSTDFPIVEIAITGSEDKEKTLRKVAKDMESEIKTIGKVGTIQKIGYRKREVQILTDIKKMEKNYISFSEIVRAIKARNVKLSGGTLESFVDERKIVTFSEFDDLQDVKDVIVRSNFTGKHIKVSDIALIKVGHKKREIISRTNGINSINMVIKRRGTTDIIDLSKKIDEVITKYKENYKGQDIDIVKVVDYTYYTKSLLNIVINNAFIGFCLVVIALFIFLNLQSAFWVAMGIPISIFGAYIFFPLFDITTNQVTLISIIMVLGMLVDDAIVIAENINRHQENGMDFREAALLGTKEMFKPVLATISTTILCFVPIYFMTGILGSFIVSIPTIVILTLGMSLFESTTLLPVHLSVGKSHSGSVKKRWMDGLQKKYAALLRFFLEFRKLTLTAFLALAIFTTIFFMKYSTFDLFPTEDFDLFYIVMETKTGTSLNETYKKVAEVEKAVAEISPDLMINYKTIVGEHKTEEAASDPALHENWALITVFLHPASQRSIRSEKIIEDLKLKVKDLKGFEKLDVRELQDGPPVGDPITVRLVSDDFKLCIKYEKKIMDFLKKVEGVYDLESSHREGKKEIRLILDYDYMAQVGITAIDLANTIRVAYDGTIATTIRRDGEEIDFRVKLRDDQRDDPEILKKLQIINNQNRLIKIEKFVSFKQDVADETMAHYNGKKSITIRGQIKKKIISSKKANDLIRDKFEQEIIETPGLSIYFGGEEEETMKSMKNFYMAFMVSILGIYFILVTLLNSYFQPFLIMVAIPFGFIGVLIAFFVHGLPMSFIGMIGSLGMIGVVVNDSLVMVTYLNSLRRKYQKVTHDIIVEGAITRLRPVILTTVTTVLGLLPTVYGWGGSEPFLVPMVLAMSWGLAFATVITLILIPVLYSFGRIKRIYEN